MPAHSLLNAGSRADELSLMEDIDHGENDGIATLDQLSTDVDDTLGPAPRTGTPTVQVVPTD